MSDRDKPPVGTVIRRQMMTNSIRVMIDFESTEDLRLAQMFPQGQSVVIAPLTAEAAKMAQVEAFVEKSGEKGPYGATAQALHKNGFYNSPSVQRHLLVGDASGAERALKDYFGVDSMTHVFPGKIIEWAILASLVHALPREVREFTSDV